MSLIDKLNARMVAGLFSGFADFAFDLSGTHY